jgi:hypothetical protein
VTNLHSHRNELYCLNKKSEWLWRGLLGLVPAEDCPRPHYVQTCCYTHPAPLTAAR